ncbi:MAG: PEP-CTERM sorting domain-containing protein [Symploca sp. SIO1A3]|nr:PEP-CTERM sorting domain-containing protein [Symploca sp. SIO1A3]
MATFTVTNLLDFGTGSLRQAILDANGLGGADEIFFDFGLSGGTINLTGGELLITDDLTISGLGADFLSVDAGGFSRVFNIGGTDPIDVLFEGLTITGGTSNGNGGGILNNFNSALTLTNSIISGNQAAFDGGGIANLGTLTVIESLVSGNLAGDDAAGLVNFSSGTLMVIDSTLSGNSAVDVGGGIGNNGELTVINSSVSENSARLGGGVQNFLGQATIIDSTLNNNSSRVGGGIFNEPDPTSILTVTNSTISGNTAETNGGGIFNGSSSRLNVSNSTITDNTADSDGNGSGDGGGIFNLSSAEVENTIIAGNFDATNNAGLGNILPDVSGEFTSNGYNLIGNADGGTGFNAIGDLVGTSTNLLDPLLGSLQDNGGRTLTHALLSGSPAIDAGDPNFTPPPEFDQRGIGFNRIVYGNNDTIAVIDIGAFEVQQQPTSVPEPSSMLGLFGIVIWGTGSILRRKQQQKL